MKVVHNCEELRKESDGSYQSVWMAHWTRTDIYATGQRFSAGENESSARHDVNHVQIAPGVSGSSKQIEEIGTSRTLEIMKQSVRGGNLETKELSFQSLPVDGSCRNGRTLSSLQKNKEARGSQSSQSLSKLHEGKNMRGVQELIPVVDTVAQIHEEKRRTTSCCLPKSSAAATEISCGQSRSRKSMEKMNAHAIFSNSSYVGAAPFQDISESASGIILYRSGSGKQVFEFGRSAMSSFMGSHFVHANDQLMSGDIKQSETEPYRCTNHPPNFLGTSSIKNHTSSGKTSTPYRRLASLKDPSISYNRSSVSRGDHLPLQNFPGFRRLQFSSHDSSPEQTELDKFHDGYSFMRKLPPLVPRIETHRIGANLDFVGASSGFFPIFSPHTRNMFITKNTDVKFGKEGIVKNVGVSSNMDVNAYLSSSSPFVHHGHQGVKIQSLGSSTDTEGNKYHEDSKDSETNLKNASSAETDAMDMDAFTEGCQTSGVNESSFKKALNSKTMQFSFDKSGTGTGNTYSNSELPDINVELSAANNTTEGAVPSSSKTQSLEMDMLLAYPARTNNSISGPCLNIFPKTDPTGRWAKRLKSGASDTQGFGTQSFDLEDGPRNKMKRTSDTFTSELLGGNPKEKLTEPDKAKAFHINDATSSKVGRQRGKDLLLSQSWIQRWLRNQAGSPKKQSDALVLCEPQSSKLALDDLHKKQFPSIAAMALMGKAMNGFEPCELQNRGTFVVWN